LDAEGIVRWLDGEDDRHASRELSWIPDDET